jgi:DNA-binding FadR family transcriptional regulator
LAETLRTEIITGVWGHHGLPAERELLIRFGVSRPTYREALRLLEAQGLIKRQRGAKGGAKILLPEIGPISVYSGAFLQMHGATGTDIFMARQVIEPAAVRLLAARCTPAILTELAQCAVAQRFCVGNQQLTAIEETKFRKLLLKYCGSVILNLLGNIVSDVADAHAANLQVRVPLSDRLIKQQKASARLKDRLIEALRAGDANESERLWSLHLKAALKAAVESAEAAGILQLYVPAGDAGPPLD